MGVTEIVFIFLIYLLLFGSKGIPSFARTMGKAVREFRSATDQIQREILSTSDDIRKDVNHMRDSVDPLNSVPHKPQPKSKNDQPEASAEESNQS
ncbi:MAG: twin-arginine translocase TatA/TatE family subunit [Bacteroidetes bacterium]|nr:twin-arginine translocase TatA/TatE family subunit [Bacteroidota bacterium]MDA1336676.1 twin-arginine translocase TatA/TatE family subunit [Bacteroidota bacterium]